MHFGHFICDRRKRHKLALDLVQFNTNVPAVTVVQQGPHPRFDQPSVRMDRMINQRLVRQIKPNQRRVRCAQDGIMKINRGFFDKLGRVCCPACGFEAHGCLYRQTALVGKQPKADQLCGGQRCHNKKHELNAK